MGPASGAAPRGVRRRVRAGPTDQIVYAKLMGAGVADVAAAKLAYDAAREQGVGLEMDW